MRGLVDDSAGTLGRRLADDDERPDVERQRGRESSATVVVDFRTGGRLCP